MLTKRQFCQILYDECCMSSDGEPVLDPECIDAKLAIAMEGLGTLPESLRDAVRHLDGRFLYCVSENGIGRLSIREMLSLLED